MTVRRPMIAGNWKMYKTCAEAEDTARALVNQLTGKEEADVMIAPPATALVPVSRIIADTPVDLGGQNLFWEAEGAYTGEVSGPMLASAGCRYVIIGHSERRQYFGETDEGVNKKIKAAVSADLVPVVCIGETETERDLGRQTMTTGIPIRSSPVTFAIRVTPMTGRNGRTRARVSSGGTSLWVLPVKPLRVAAPGTPGGDANWPPSTPVRLWIAACGTVPLHKGRKQVAAPRAVR